MKDEIFIKLGLDENIKSQVRDAIKAYMVEIVDEEMPDMLREIIKRAFTQACDNEIRMIEDKYSYSEFRNEINQTVKGIIHKCAKTWVNDYEHIIIDDVIESIKEKFGVYVERDVVRNSIELLSKED